MTSIQDPFGSSFPSSSQTNLPSTLQPTKTTNEIDDDEPVIEDVEYTGKKDEAEMITTKNDNDGFGDFAQT